MSTGGRGSRVSVRKRPQAFGRRELSLAEQEMGLNSDSQLHMITLTGAPIESLEALGITVRLQHLQRAGSRRSWHYERARVVVVQRAAGAHCSVRTNKAR